MYFRENILENLTPIAKICHNCLNFRIFLQAICGNAKTSYEVYSTLLSSLGYLPHAPNV
jgi:hypothetical protein